jgi:siroheme synthase
MPVKTLPGLIAQACAAGLDPATPVVAVANATRADERTIAGRVADFPALLAAEAPSGPVIVMIGSVFAGYAREPVRETAPLESVGDAPRRSASG